MAADGDPITRAAALAFAMLQFEQEAAHPRRGTPKVGKVLGVDEFLFLPSWKPTPRAEAIHFLADLPCPALLFQTTMRGAVSVLLLDELTGERKAWAQKTLDNQLAGLNQLASQFSPPLSGDSKILLEVRDEAHVVPLDILRLWASRFSCPVGWNMGEPRAEAPADVSAQMRLLSPDGRVSPPSATVAPWDRPAW